MGTQTRSRKSVYYNVNTLSSMNPELAESMGEFIEAVKDVPLFTRRDDKNNIEQFNGTNVVGWRQFDSASDLIDKIEFSFKLPDNLRAAEFAGGCKEGVEKVARITFKKDRYEISDILRKGSVLHFSFKKQTVELGLTA